MWVFSPNVLHDTCVYRKCTAYLANELAQFGWDSRPANAIA